MDPYFHFESEEDEVSLWGGTLGHPGGHSRVGPSRALSSPAVTWPSLGGLEAALQLEGGGKRPAGRLGSSMVVWMGNNRRAVRARNQMAL